MQQLLIGRYIRNINMIQALRCKLGASLRYAELRAVCNLPPDEQDSIARVTVDRGG